MIVCYKIEELKLLLKSYKAQNQTIGFVPTMGALHKGHISLIQTAKSQTDIVVCSIFVNPTQFNNMEDLEKYPRTLDKDCELLKNANCDIVFAPEISELYTKEELLLKQKGVEDKSWAGDKNIDFGVISTVMEGEFRPGHFNGVAQIVSKLFKIVNPHRAFFGQKDFQQLAIIKSLVYQMGFEIEIIPCETIRESNGLAMSSRNERLSPVEREKAALIYKTLLKVKELVNTKSVSELKEFVKIQIATEPAMELEYFEIADINTLQPVSKIKNAVACIAVHIGAVRLIDNLILVGF